MHNAKKAFTLIEALVSVVILAIGFAGVYALVSTSSRVMSDSIDKEKLKFQNTEIIESLHADQANILEYNGKDLSSCNSIKTSKDKEEQLKRLKAWCEKLQGEVGDKRSQDKRIIRVVKQKVGENYVYVVSIELSGKSDKKSVFMKRIFNAD
jgi:prepilin-type N-terminal cleavage/methylation domain-containing protein